ncbi:MAG TPA: NUDIX hydrolase, partial [Erythrobacter sp.]|nr:NUDIX hydrolase [Erythrobacter sp.]
GVGEENITVHRVPLADIRSFIDAKRADGCGIDVRMLLLLGQNILGGE